MAALAEELEADVILVGSRGLGGTKAVLGSVSDVIGTTAPRRFWSRRAPWPSPPTTP